MRLILPCAGFGTRVNMPPDQSKELLLYEGKPLIEFSLELARKYGLAPLVITRKEKTDLIEYCEKLTIETQIIEVEGEWADTVLKSEPYWEDNNILILPDTIFHNKWFAMDIINDSLITGLNASFALHKVENSSKWGIIRENRLYEKPQFDDQALAWGLMGFKKDYGKQLFSSCHKGGCFILNNYSTMLLESFEDLTRDPIKYNLTNNKT